MVNPATEGNEANLAIPVLKGPEDHRVSGDEHSDVQIRRYSSRCHRCSWPARCL